jgi:anti-sigma B factor antagonist
MAFKSFDKDGVTVLELTGRITLGSGDIKMRDLIKEHLDAGKKRIVVDLGGVSFVDSSGLGELVAAYTSARRANVTIKLANLTKKIDDLMEITRLASVFETYGSVDEAVQSFNG